MFWKNINYYALDQAAYFDGKVTLTWVVVFKVRLLRSRTILDYVLYFEIKIVRI